MIPNSIVSAEEFGGSYVFISNYIPLGSIYWRSNQAATLLSMWDIVSPSEIGSSEQVTGLSDIQEEIPGIWAASIASEESVSEIRIDATIHLSGVGSDEYVSSVRSLSTDSRVDSVESAEAVSNVDVIIDLVIFVGSITTGFAAGSVSIGRSISVNEISSAEAFGSATFSTLLIITPNSILSGEALPSPSVNYVLLAYPNSINSSEAFDPPSFSQTIHIPSIYEDSGVSETGVSLTKYVDEIESAENVSDLYINYVEYVEADSVVSDETFSIVETVADARIRPSSLTTNEVFGYPQVGINVVISPVSIDSNDRLPKAYLHHPVSDLGISDTSDVSTITALVQIEPAFPLSIISEEMVNNVNAVIEGVVNPFALSSDSEMGFVGVLISSVIGANSAQDGEEFGEIALGLNVTEIVTDSLESLEQFGSAVVSDTFVPAKVLDQVYSDQPLSVEYLYGDNTVDRVWDGAQWQWDVANSYYSSNYTWVHSWTTYEKKWIPPTGDSDGYWEPYTIDHTSLHERFQGLSYQIWSQLVYESQLPWHRLKDQYYGSLEEWILHGTNVDRPVSTTDSGAVTNQTFGVWHVNNPIGELTDTSPGGSEFVLTNLSVVDDRIPELRGSSPAGIMTAGVPQQVFATISAVTAEATDTFSSFAEYTIEDKVANYELYEGISVSPSFNYIFRVPEPTYIQGIPVLPVMRTDPLCSIDIISPALKISRDSSGKLEFFGVAPDVYGETNTAYDTVDDLPPTLYRPLRPPKILPEDPTSEWQEPDPYDLPDIPDTWDGWEPEDDESDTPGADDGWDETPEGVTPGGGTRYRDFPINLSGGGTVILSGVPKYKNNGKKKWLFATGKKKKKKADDGNCVDDPVDDGPRYIGMYIKNGKLVLTDGEYVLRCDAPPRGQKVLVFAGYYGKKSYVGWWKNPRKYNYRLGQMVDRSESNQGVTTIMIGRGWGTRSATDLAGNGFTIGTLKIVDESTTAGSAGSDPNLSTPTSVLLGIAMQETNTPSPNPSDNDTTGTSDPYVLDPNNPNNSVLRQISDQIRDLNSEINRITKNLSDYPNMPADQRSAAEASLTALRALVSQLRSDYQTRASLEPPHWVTVAPTQADEYKQYVADYNKWKYQPRMIGYFSINDTSRVGVPGVR